MDILPAGTVLEGRYRLDVEIARGGMGVVYRATQLAVGRTVAVKLLAPERALDDTARARFAQEAKTLAALQHPHVVALVDFGELPDGRLYLVMEHLEGEPLSAVCAREAPLPPTRVQAIAVQLLQALAAAHARGLVHRDLKPANVFLVRYQHAADFVKLLDFGIAKALADAGARVDLTDSRDVLGSPRYLSPEQAQRRPITAASDFYGLGCVLYELLSGKPLFDDEDTPIGCLMAHIQRAPPPIVVGGVALEGPLVAWTMRCLAKAPWDRPASAAEMLAGLSAGTGTSPGSASMPPRPRRWLVPAIAGAGAAIGIAVALALPSGPEVVPTTRPPDPLTMRVTAPEATPSRAAPIAPIAPTPTPEVVEQAVVPEVVSAPPKPLRAPATSAKRRDPPADQDKRKPRFEFLPVDAGAPK